MNKKNTTYTYVPYDNQINEAREDMADLGKGLADRANQSVGRDFTYSLSSLALVNPLAAGAVVGVGLLAATIYGISTSTAIRAMRCRRRLHSLYSKVSSPGGYGTGGADYLHGAISQRDTFMSGSIGPRREDNKNILTSKSRPVALGPLPLKKSTIDNIKKLNIIAEKYVNKYKDVKPKINGKTNNQQIDIYNDSVAEGMGILQAANSNYYGVSAFGGGNVVDDSLLTALLQKRRNETDQAKRDEYTKQINKLYDKNKGSLDEKNKKIEPLRNRFDNMLSIVDTTGKGILNNFDIKNKRGLDAGRNKVVVASNKLKAQWDTLYDTIKRQADESFQSILKSEDYKKYVKNIEWIKTYLSEEEPENNMQYIEIGNLYTYTNTKKKLRMLEVVDFDADKMLYVTNLVNTNTIKKFDDNAFKKLNVVRVIANKEQISSIVKGNTYRILTSNYTYMYVTISDIKSITINGRNIKELYYRIINDKSNTIYSKYEDDFIRVFEPKKIIRAGVNESYKNSSTTTLNEAVVKDNNVNVKIENEIEESLLKNAYVNSGTFVLTNKEGKPSITTGGPEIGNVNLSNGGKITIEDWISYNAIEVPAEYKDDDDIDDEVINDIIKVNDIDPNKVPLTYKEFHDAYYKNATFSKFVNEVLKKYENELMEYSISPVGKDMYMYYKKGTNSYNEQNVMSHKDLLGKYINFLGNKILIEKQSDNLSDKNESVNMSYNIFLALNEDVTNKKLASAYNKKINKGIEEYCKIHKVDKEDVIKNPKKYGNLLKAIDKKALEEIIKLANDNVNRSNLSKEEKQEMINNLSKIEVSYVSKPKDLSDRLESSSGVIAHKNYRTTDTPDEESVTNKIMSILNPKKEEPTKGEENKGEENKGEDKKGTDKTENTNNNIKTSTDGDTKNVVTDVDDGLSSNDETIEDIVTNNESPKTEFKEQENLEIVRKVCLEIKKLADGTLSKIVEIISKNKKLKVGDTYLIDKKLAKQYIEGLIIKESLNEEDVNVETKSENDNVNSSDNSIEAKVIKVDDSGVELEIENKVYKVKTDIIDKLQLKPKQEIKGNELVSMGIVPIDPKTLTFVTSGESVKLKEVLKKSESDNNIKVVIDNVLNLKKSDLAKFGVTNIEELSGMIDSISNGYPKYEIGKKYTITYKKDNKPEKMEVVLEKEDNESLYLKSSDDQFKIKKTDWLTFDPILNEKKTNESVNNLIYSLYKIKLNESYVLSVSNIKDAGGLLSEITKMILNEVNKKQTQQTQQTQQQNQQTQQGQQTQQQNQQTQQGQQTQNTTKQEVANANQVQPTTSVSSGIVIEYIRDNDLKESLSKNDCCIAGCVCGDYYDVTKLNNVINRIKKCKTKYELGKLIKENENFTVCSVSDDNIKVTVPIKNANNPFDKYDPVYEKLVIVSIDNNGNILNVSDNKLVKLIK